MVIWIMIPLLTIGCMILFIGRDWNNLFISIKFKELNENGNKDISTIDFNRSKFERLVFIKTHKTCSSTITSLLWRELCYVKKKRCFLPPNDSPGHTWNLNYPKDLKYILNTTISNLNKSEMKPPFDIWLHHIIYDKEQIALLVQPPYFLMSIIRRPAFRFRSAWIWYQHSKKFYHTKLSSFISFVSIVMKWIGKKNWWFIENYFFKYRTGLDSISEELLGIRKKDGINKFQLKFNKLLNHIKNREIYLLICDRLEESLLVMKYLLGWDDWDALVYYQFKAANFNENEYKLSEEELLQLDSLQYFDLTVYQLANVMLDQYLREIYERSFGSFENDLNAMRNHRACAYHHCNITNHIEFQNVKIPSKCEGLNYDDKNCFRLRLDNKDIVHLQHNKPD